MFELVIFDCDGVLVDSEHITNTVLAELLNELGLSVNLNYMYEHFMGKSMSQCMGLITSMLGKSPPSNFEESYRERSRIALENGLRPVLGVPEMLQDLQLPCCVASSGSHDKMRTTLSITGLLPRFAGRLYSVTEVAHGKPAPDVFLYAAAQCGAKPDTCAVVEDTPTGVAAGVAAGMIVFGYTGMIPAGRLQIAGAHHTFEHMRELNGLLTAQNKN
ncbi:MAG TPA: HAD family hydrolase [Gammaproteobacteria bacterium]|nr:HAD family hydrolase [Gammaproteobacteria bacterium]